MLRNIQLPFIVWVVILSTLMASIGGQFFNYQIAGLGWFVPLVLSIMIFLKTPGRVKFPVLIWLPWILLVIIYLIFAKAPNAFQRTIMMLCPLVIGMTVSKLRIGQRELESFNKLCRYLAVALYVVVIVKGGIIVTGALPVATGMAAEVMTGTLLCSLFAVRYVLGQKKELAWWAAFAVIPYIAVTRTAIVAAGLTLPLTFAPMKIWKRFVLVILIVMLAIPVFYSERVQQKMFYSSRGTFAEVHPDNPDLATNGRKSLWGAMQAEIDEEPYWGHGANSSEPFVFMRTGGLTHPHNDWLRLLYDYGYVGASVFAFCLIAQVFHVLKRSTRATGETKILFYAAASTFISFVLFMFSDNIILYAAFFGNLQFTILGLAYAAYASSSADKKVITLEKRIRYHFKW
jgi:O-antigen ligase